ncbi:MAG: MFS transporter [Candidatus Velthaea sp.]
MAFNPGSLKLRYAAVAACGASAFIDMYATQPLLPELRHEFAASEAAVALTISALTLACALAAPFAGPLADRLGRKRVIVVSIVVLGAVTLGAASATTLPALVAWRFAQGLVMPGIFATTLAYIAEEFPRGVGGRAVGAYIGGNVFGGFFGRYASALVAEHFHWQSAFVLLGCLNFAGALLVWGALPRARNFRRSASLRASLAAVGGFLRDPVLIAIFVVGGSVLFTLVAAFTFATFYLAGPPFDLSTAALGNVFAVYLLGAVATPLSGRLIDRFGHRNALFIALATSAAGLAITLLPSLAGVVAGLALMSTGVFCAQAASQGFIGVYVGGSRSTAAALYLTVYYTGGGLGAIVPAYAWTHGGWGATVAEIAGVQVFAALLTAFVWPRRAAAAGGAVSTR